MNKGRVVLYIIHLQVTPAVSDSLRLMPTTPLLIEGIVVDQTGHMSGINPSVLLITPCVLNNDDK